MIKQRMRATVAAAVVLVLAGCSSDAPEEQDGPKTALQGQAIDIKNTYSCPAPPADGNGNSPWLVNNTSGKILSVYVADDKDLAYQVLERVGSPTQREWTPKLADGTYHLVCVFKNTSARSGAEFTISGSQFAPTQGFMVVTAKDIDPIAMEHSRWQKTQLPEWVTADDALLAAIQAGDRTQARKAWLNAYGKYRTFDDSNGEWPEPAGDIGDFGTKPPSAGTPPDVKGYHRVEWGLWNGEPMSALVPVAQQLNKDVHSVTDSLTTEGFILPAVDYGLRTHEITEELERFDLAGLKDFGAHATGIAMSSDVESTRHMLEPLRNILSSRGFDVEALDNQLQLLSDLGSEMTGKYGTTKGILEWEQTDRARVDAATAQLNELLAPVATMTIIRRI